MQYSTMLQMSRAIVLALSSPSTEFKTVVKRYMVT